MALNSKQDPHTVASTIEIHGDLLDHLIMRKFNPIGTRASGDESSVFLNFEIQD